VQIADSLRQRPRSHIHVEVMPMQYHTRFELEYTLRLDRSCQVGLATVVGLLAPAAEVVVEAQVRMVEANQLRVPPRVALYYTRWIMMRWRYSDGACRGLLQADKAQYSPRSDRLDRLVLLSERC